MLLLHFRHVVISHRLQGVGGEGGLSSILPRGATGGVQLRIQNGDTMMDFLQNLPLPAPGGQPRLQRVRLAPPNPLAHSSLVDGNSQGQLLDVRSMLPFARGGQHGMLGMCKSIHKVKYL